MPSFWEEGEKSGSGNDSDLLDIEWNTGLHDFIVKNHFKKIYFTSKKVYHWYKIHIGRVPGVDEIILLSPSSNGVRSIPRMAEYQVWVKDVGAIIVNKTTLFRIEFYQKVFAPKVKGKK